MNFSQLLTAVCRQFPPSHCMFFCCSLMQIMKRYEGVCELHRRRSCTLWCLSLTAWTSPPSLNWTLPLWEAGTPWCPGITYSLPTHQTEHTVLILKCLNLLEIHIAFRYYGYKTWLTDAKETNDTSNYRVKSVGCLFMWKCWRLLKTQIITV